MIQLSLLDIIDDFVTANCIKGAISTEVGSRAHNLHIQGVIELHYPRAPTYVKILTQFVKDLIPDRKGHKVIVKPFTLSQTFQTMVGYVFKDQGKPHFQTRYLFTLTFYMKCYHYFSNIIECIMLTYKQY